jgi:hypothetical protein
VFLTAHDSTERQNACLREIHDVYSLFIDAKDLCVSYLLKDNIYIYIYLLIYICQYLVFKNWQMTRKSEIPSFAKCDRDHTESGSSKGKSCRQLDGNLVRTL